MFGKKENLVVNDQENKPPVPVKEKPIRTKSNIVEWYYDGEADITIGETEISKTAKILLIALVIVLVILAGLGIYFRSYVYDYIVNPQPILKENEIFLEVYSPFDPNSYIITKDANRYTYSYTGEVDPNTLGTYTITYTSTNSVRTNVSDLIVHIVDTTPPVLVLSRTEDELIRGDEGTQNFNPADYIESVSDNFSDTDDITISYSDTFDFSQSSVSVPYMVTDENNNSMTTTLNITVVSPTPTPTPSPTPTPAPSPTPAPANPNNPGGGGNGGGATPTPVPAGDPVFTAGSFSIPMSQVNQLYPQAAQYVTLRNIDAYASPISGPGIDSQFDIGTYTIVWQAGSYTCNQTVTITDG